MYLSLSFFGSYAELTGDYGEAMRQDGDNKLVSFVCEMEIDGDGFVVVEGDRDEEGELGIERRGH